MSLLVALGNCLFYILRTFRIVDIASRCIQLFGCSCFGSIVKTSSCTVMHDRTGKCLPSMTSTGLMYGN